jgi:hypothetical protein
MTKKYAVLTTSMVLFLCFGCSNKAPKYTNTPINLKEIDFTVKLPYQESVDSRDSTFETQHFKFQFEESILTREHISEIVQTCEGNISRVLSILNLEALSDKIDYVIYPDIEKKGMSLQNGALSQVSHTSQQVYTVTGEYFKGYEFHPENELILRNQYGKTPHSAIEKGLAIYLNPTWQLKGYDYWAARLFTSGNLPPLTELLDEEFFAIESDLVMGCAAASFVDFLISENIGKEAFLKSYKEYVVTDSEIGELQTKWVVFLNKKYTQSNIVKKQRQFPWLKGFNFAHEGYRIYNGYGSNQAEQSMEKMMDIGSNSLAIVPYSYMRNDDKPTFLPIMRRAGSETDESVITTHMQAKKLNGYTILKPQIWMRGSWPGSIKMKSEKDWSQFFDYYYRWMRHYALIAEIWNMDMLCVGVEFAEATQSHPEEWRQLIKKLRGIYSGPMIYAANWGDEFEKITFWDELDYIGLNCYYPLSKKESPDREELEEGFRKTILKIEKICNTYNKPLIFTEIGFRSVEKPWIQPHEEPNGKAINEDHQSLC